VDILGLVFSAIGIWIAVSAFAYLRRIAEATERTAVAAERTAAAAEALEDVAPQAPEIQIH